MNDITNEVKALNKLHEIEEKHNLFNHKVSKVNVWKYIRNDFYNLLLSTEYESESIFKQTKNANIEKRFLAIKAYLRYQFKQLFKAEIIEQKDVIVFSFPRKLKIDGKFICPYTHYIKEKLNSFIAFERPLWIEDTSHSLKGINNKNDYFLDWIEGKYYLNLHTGKYKKDIKYPKINSLIDILKSEVRNLDRQKFQDMIIESIIFELTALPIYSDLLEKIKPKLLIEVYTPGKHLAVLNEVANERNIPIIDVQHGAIGDVEPAMYSYKRKKQYKHLFNHIFLFGDSWKRKSNFHVKNDRLHAIGNVYLEKFASKMPLEKDEKIRVLIVSQTRFTNLFITITNSLADLLDTKKYDLTLKLHPFEHSISLDLKKNNIINENVRIESGLDKHVYEHIKNSDIVVGINSTVLYEAHYLNKPIIVYNTYGASDIYSIINENIYICNDVNEIFYRILNMKRDTNNFDRGKIYTSNSIMNSINKINELIKE